MYRKLTVLILFFVFLIFFSVITKAQVHINSINIEGNDKTKKYIILRELPYHAGDNVNKDSLSFFNNLAQQQLFNTSLFLVAKVSAEYPLPKDSSIVNIHIQVQERWYFIPKPIFKWVDRNFSQWWNEQNHSLDRVNYGINLSMKNATGNNDRLVLGFVAGYTQQNIIRYQFPYLDKKLRYGMGIGWQNYTQKEINYTTEFDKQIFLKTIGMIREGYRANVDFLYRPNLFEHHSLQFGFGKDALSDSGFLMQPLFLPNHNNSFSYADVTLDFKKIKFDYNAYPTQGSATEFIAYQRFSSAASLTSFQYRKIIAHSFSKQNFIFVESNSIVKFVPNFNYSDYRLLGYGNLQLNGLEYYVVDGNAASILKTSFHHLLGGFTVKNPIKTRYLTDFKYDFWIRFFTQLGYVYNDHSLNTNRLSNTLLRTVGIGLDIISIYDFVLKIDYSLNQLGDKGVYLHGGINF